MLSRRRFLQAMLAGGISAAMGGLPRARAAADTVQLTILGTSDVHGRFMPWDYATDTEDRSGSRRCAGWSYRHEYADDHGA